MFRTFRHSRPARRPAAPPRRYRPGVETLEERCVPARLPVIVVPGLTGSLPVGVNDSDPNKVLASLIQFAFNEGQQPDQLTALFNINVNFFGNPIKFASPYITLVNSLEADGYTLGKDLFVAAYDWREAVAPTDGVLDGRLPNVTAPMITAGTYQYGIDYLGHTLQVAQQVWEANNPGQALPGVDIIAHSMGNVVTRSYIQSAAYHGAYTDTDGTVKRLPLVNHYIMLSPPNDGASQVFNLVNNNFNGTGTDSVFNQDIVQYFLNPVFNSLGSMPVNNTFGQPFITPASVTNPTTGQPDPKLFINQYAPGLFNLLPTYNFLNGTNVNGNPNYANTLMLDLNGGPDPNSFASNKSVTDFYGYTVATPDTVSTEFGQGGMVLPISTTVNSPRPTQDGEVWYLDNVLPASGDGTVGIQSLLSTFPGDPRITLVGIGGGVNHSGIVIDPNVLGQINAILSTGFVVPSVLATGADAGGAPVVNVYNAITGAQTKSFTALPSFFTGGVRVAVGDVNRDNNVDIVTGAGPGGGPLVTVYDGSTFQPLRSFFAFPTFFTGGVYVAAGDVNGDGYADVIVGAGPGGGPEVKVFSGKDNALLLDVYALPAFFTGGVRVAAADVNNDGRADLIVGAGPGGGPEVVVIDGATGNVITAFFALPATFTGGVFVAGGDFNGDGFADVIGGAGAGAGPQVSVFDGKTHAVLGTFYALPVGFTGGVRVGFSPAFGTDARPAILTAAGPGGGPQVGGFDTVTLQALGSFFAYSPGFSNGVFVAGGVG